MDTEVHVMSHHQSENRIILLTLPVMQKYTEISKFFIFPDEILNFAAWLYPYLSSTAQEPGIKIAVRVRGVAEK